MISEAKPPAPSKVLAVHLNYPSRAAERGRIPSLPSYFLKPPSSISASGVPVRRPQGSSLLCFEGELAVVIGRRAHGLAPEEAMDHVGWYAAANDFGLYDLRWADRGSNLLSKGQDGFTPLSSPVAADGIDPKALAIRTLVNGEVIQEDTTTTLLFPIEQLIADLTRFITLEPGDILLTGTPAGSRPTVPGDVVEVAIDGVGQVSSPIEEGGPVDDYGAIPRATPQARAAAFGQSVPRPVVLSPEAKRSLGSVSCATLTVQLRKRGIRDTFIRGARPIRPGSRMLGYAHTLRYVPLREDILAADTADLNAQKRAVETIAEEEVLVIEARGELGAGTIGDILAMRAQRRGAAGIVTDGAIRDTPAVAALEIPTYYAGSHAAVLGILHYPLETNVPVSCGGVLVMPGDVMVGDEEGVVVIPAALAEEVARDAREQESREAWALERVAAGESIRGVYPLGPEREEEYAEWRASHPDETPDGS
jgi:5-oxopent-3-ene-1,2,5-tricarboxylate decarboxylase/2-hydroxyhepta-2,4-diene-1,7-dioate isomerase